MKNIIQKFQLERNSTTLKAISIVTLSTIFCREPHYIITVDFTNKDILKKREEHGWDSRLFLFVHIKFADN